MKLQKNLYEFLGEAEESVRGGEKLIKDNLYDFSTGRSYQAMLYAAESALLTKNLSYTRYSDIINILDDEFIKTGILPHKILDFFVEASEIRQKLKDFGSPGAISKEKAEELLKNSIEFIDVVREYLKKQKFII